MNAIDPKKLAAEKAVEWVKEGMTIGLGTGSTAYWAIQKIGERVKEGLKIKAVASSEHSADLATELNIPIVAFEEINRIDLTIDGADEVDPNTNLIKGGGGALLREKIISSNSDTFIVVVHASKMVSELGKFPLPVEVVPFAREFTKNKIESLGYSTSWRVNQGRMYITDNGNFILDCEFRSIKDPAALNKQLHLIPGVVETGLFVDMKPKVIIGHGDGRIEILE
jgi:ribose 5-phosphate isomerase A